MKHISSSPSLHMLKSNLSLYFGRVVTDHLTVLQRYIYTHHNSNDLYLFVYHFHPHTMHYNDFCCHPHISGSVCFDIINACLLFNMLNMFIK